MKYLYTQIACRQAFRGHLQCRTYARQSAPKLRPKSTSRSAKNGSSPNQQKSPNEQKLFAFGNFASLQRPSKDHIEKNRSAIENVKSFESLRIFPSVRAAMVKEIKSSYHFKNTYVKSRDDLEIKPSPVQAAAIKKINRPRKVSAEKLQRAGSPLLLETLTDNENNKLKVFTVAAETGSGKTWAYLASVFSKLKEDDLALFHKKGMAYQQAHSSPVIRSVILLPTHELVNQVYTTASTASGILLDVEKDISKKILNSQEYGPFFQLPENRESLGLNVVKWGAGDSHTKLFNSVNSRRIDVLVTTPSKLASLSHINNVSRPFKYFGQVDYCVIDEADTLLDESWFNDTTYAIQKFPRLKDLIMCSATIPKDFERALRKIVKDEKAVIRITTPSVHKIPRQIVMKVIDAQMAPFHGSKMRCLAQAIFAIHNDGTEKGYVKRIIVFVNQKKDVEPLIETLISKYGHREEDIIGITGKDSADEREDKIEPFVKSALPLADEPHGSQIKILVTTDLLARGLNFQGVKNVILMDVPHSSADLIHRIGRTGRMHQSGRVFIIIDRKTKKSWIKGLPSAIKQGTTIG